MYIFTSFHYINIFIICILYNFNININLYFLKRNIPSLLKFIFLFKIINTNYLKRKMSDYIIYSNKIIKKEFIKALSLQKHSNRFINYLNKHFSDKILDKYALFSIITMLLVAKYEEEYAIKIVDDYIKLFYYLIDSTLENHEILTIMDQYSESTYNLIKNPTKLKINKDTYNYLYIISYKNHDFDIQQEMENRIATGELIYIDRNNYVNKIIKKYELINDPNINREYLFEYKNDQDLSKCIAIINEIIKNKKIVFYIGATNDPKNRLSDHKKEKGLNNMYLICSCSNKNLTKFVESELIKKFNKRTYNVNQSGGGEGITHENNYIYLMTE